MGAAATKPTYRSLSSESRATRDSKEKSTEADRSSCYGPRVATSGSGSSKRNRILALIALFRLAKAFFLILAGFESAGVAPSGHGGQSKGLADLTTFCGCSRGKNHSGSHQARSGCGILVR